MADSEPKRIKVVIYTNQLAWINRISTALNQTRRETFLECFAEYIGEFKQAARKARPAGSQ
jgi:hypothetical protein